MSIDRTVGVGGVTIGLIGTGIVVLWPDKRWLGWVFIALGFLIALFGIVWALAVRHTRKELEGAHNKDGWQRDAEAIIMTPQLAQTGIDFKPHIEVNPVFNQSQSQSQEQSQKQNVAEKERVPPEIECADWYFVKAFLTGWNRVSDDKSQGHPCLVAQADFHLKAVPGADKWIELRTQLIFYDSKGIERLRRVSDGVWREQGDHIQMPLNTGDTRRLIIAIEVGKTGLNSCEYAEQHLHRPRFTPQGRVYTTLAPKIEPLNVDALTVQVLLAGKFMDEVTLNQEFWFRLSQTEQKIEQIESPRGKETDMKTQF